MKLWSAFYVHPGLVWVSLGSAWCQLWVHHCRSRAETKQTPVLVGVCLICYIGSGRYCTMQVYNMLEFSELLLPDLAKAMVAMARIFGSSSFNMSVSPLITAGKQNSPATKFSYKNKVFFKKLTLPLWFVNKCNDKKIKMFCTCYILWGRQVIP